MNRLKMPQPRHQHLQKGWRLLMGVLWSWPCCQFSLVRSVLWNITANRRWVPPTACCFAFILPSCQPTDKQTTCEHETYGDMWGWLLGLEDGELYIAPIANNGNHQRIVIFPLSSFKWSSGTAVTVLKFVHVDHDLSVSLTLTEWHWQWWSSRKNTSTAACLFAYRNWVALLPHTRKVATSTSPLALELLSQKFLKTLPLAIVEPYQIPSCLHDIDTGLWLTGTSVINTDHVDLFKRFQMWDMITHKHGE